MEDVQIDATVPVDPIVTSLCSPDIPNFEFVNDATEKLEIGDTSVDDCDDSLGDSMVCDPNSRLVPTGFTRPNRTGSIISPSISISKIRISWVFSCYCFSFLGKFPFWI